MLVREDLMFGRPEASRDEMIVAARGWRGRFISAMPNGYETDVRRRGGPPFGHGWSHAA